MGQFDNLKSIAMLLLGALLISFGIIAFLNLDIQSRSNCDSKIRPETLFEVLSRKINRLISALREKNSHRKALLRQLFISENNSRKFLRKLQYFTEDSKNITNSITQRYLTTAHHRVRHKKKIRKASELFVKEKDDDIKNKFQYSNGDFSINYNNHHEFQSTKNNEINLTTKNLEKEIKVHQQCYSTNDVLKIIAITCLVNFFFWFIIIISVNIFTKNTKVLKFNSLESLTSIESKSESDLDQTFIKKEENQTSVYMGCLHKNNLCVSSTEIDGNNIETELIKPLLPGLRKDHSQGTSNHENWLQQRFLHLSQFFFDSTPSDNIKPTNKKKLLCVRKKNKIVNSFSMEDLIF